MSIYMQLLFKVGKDSELDEVCLNNLVQVYSLWMWYISLKEGKMFYINVTLIGKFDAISGNTMRNQIKI